MEYVFTGKSRKIGWTWGFGTSVREGKTPAFNTCISKTIITVDKASASLPRVSLQAFSSRFLHKTMGWISLTKRAIHSQFDYSRHSTALVIVQRATDFLG